LQQRSRKAYNDAKALICEKEFALKKLEYETSEIARIVKEKHKARKRKEKSKISPEETKRKLFVARKAPFSGLLSGIPISETILDDIQEIVSKLKI
jgi:hypothetical protein